MENNPPKEIKNYLEDRLKALDQEKEALKMEYGKAWFTEAAGIAWLKTHQELEDCLTKVLEISAEQKEK